MPIDNRPTTCHNTGVTRTDRTMTSAQLTPHIRYVALSDDDGDFGILLNHLNGIVINAVEVYDRAMFERVFNEMVSLSTPVESVA